MFVMLMCLCFVISFSNSMCRKTVFYHGYIVFSYSYSLIFQSSTPTGGSNKKLQKEIDLIRIFNKDDETKPYPILSLTKSEK